MPHRVLVVDDNLMMVKILERYLAGSDFTVAGTAGNGEDAVKAFSELKPDLVIMDIMMPKMDGHETLRRIRELDAAARVIIMSAAGTRQNVEKALEGGAASFLLKPFSSRQAVLDVLAQVAQA